MTDNLTTRKMLALDSCRGLETVNFSSLSVSLPDLLAALCKVNERLRRKRFLVCLNSVLGFEQGRQRQGISQSIYPSVRTHKASSDRPRLACSYPRFAVP